MNRPNRLPTLLALALAALVLSPAVAAAKCMSGNLTVWPPPDTALPAEPMILLDGFGSRQVDITQLAEGGTARLVAPKQRIALKIETINTGAFGLTQAVVTPAEALRPGTRYVLELLDVNGERLRTVHFHKGEPRPIAWTTAEAASASTAPLALTQAPKVTGQNFRRLGCGPASRIDVSVAATSSAPVAVEVKLKELGVEDAALQTYVVPLKDGVLRLGHGMCSGAFRLTGAERRFRAELVVRDAAGDAIAVPESLEFAGVDPMGGFGKFPIRR